VVLQLSHGSNSHGDRRLCEATCSRTNTTMHLAYDVDADYAVFVLAQVAIGTPGRGIQCSRAIARS
jgi:hypothetical protein